jgi:hypothetical protein
VYTDKEMFRKLIHRQNQYLACHRNIPMDGFDNTLLNAHTSTGKDLIDEIMVGAQIFRVDTSSMTKEHLGRHNVSTTEEHYVAAIEWLDTTLPLLIETILPDGRCSFNVCWACITPSSLLWLYHRLPPVHCQLLVRANPRHGIQK